MDYTPFVVAFGLFAAIITLMGGIIVSLRSQLRMAERKLKNAEEDRRFDRQRIESMSAQISRTAHANARRAEESARRAEQGASLAQRSAAAAVNTGRGGYPAPPSGMSSHSAFTPVPSSPPLPDPFLNPALQPLWWPPVPQHLVHPATPSSAPEPCSSSSWGSSSDSSSSSSSSSDSGSSSSSSD